MINWKHFGQMVILFMAYLAFVAALMWISITLSGCSYASGQINADGSLSFVSFRPYLDKHKTSFTYVPETKEFTLNVDTEVEHLNLSQLGAMIGTAMKAAK